MTLAPLVPLGIVVVLAVAAAVWVAVTWATSRSTGRLVRQLGMIVLGVALVLRPGDDVEHRRQARLLDVDVVFAVDVTTSMSAEDYDGDRPRFVGVQADVDALVDDLAGARFSMVTFGADAIVDLPFTTDARAVSTVAGTLRAEPYRLATGSSIERPVELLTSVLDSAADADADRVRVLVVMTDGEEIGDVDESGLGSYGDLADLVDAAVVLGYGTEAGGPMRETEVDIAFEDGSYIHESSTGQIALSRIDEDNLRAIADDLGAEYRHRDRPGGLSGLIEPGTVEVGTGEAMVAARSDIVWLPGIGLGLLLLWELGAVTLTGRDLRRWWP